MHIEVAAKTDVGRERSHNEDSYLVLESQKVFVVCDGMGGHQAGDVASQSAVRVLDYWLNEKRETDLSDIVKDVEQPIPEFGKRLIAASRLANRYIYNTTPDASTVDLRYTDMEAEEGLNYYYFRVLQDDGEVAWSSPIWINRSK